MIIVDVTLLYCVCAAPWLWSRSCESRVGFSGCRRAAGTGCSRRPVGWEGTYLERSEILAPVLGLIDATGTVLWDFDGVIADSEPVQELAYSTLLSVLGREPAAGFFDRHRGGSEPDIWSHLVVEFELAEPIADLASRRADIYHDLTRSMLRPAWFVRPLLDYSRARGYPSLIVSSNNFATITFLLSEWGLENYFSGVYSLDSPLAQSLPDKSARLRHVLASNPRAVLLEDTPRYLQLARSCGARVVGVQHGHNDLSGVELDSMLSHDF